MFSYTKKTLLELRKQVKTASDQGDFYKAVDAVDKMMLLPLSTDVLDEMKRCSSTLHQQINAQKRFEATGSTAEPFLHPEKTEQKFISDYLLEHMAIIKDTKKATILAKLTYSAQKAWDKEDYATVIRLTSAILSQYEQDIVTRTMRGTAIFKHGDTKHDAIGISDITALLERYKTADNYTLRARFYLRSKEYTLAKNDLLAAIQDESNKSLTLCNDILFYLKQLDPNIEPTTLSIEQLLAEGNKYLLQDQFEKAKVIFTQAINCNKVTVDSGNYYHIFFERRGEANRRLKNYLAAMHDYTIARWVSANFSGKDPKLAIKYLSKLRNVAIEMGSNLAPSLQLHQLIIGLEADEKCKKQINNEFSQVLLNFAECAVLDYEFETAIEYMEVLIKFNPDNTINYRALANIYLQMNRSEDAKNILEKSLRINSKNAEFLETLNKLPNDDCLNPSLSPIQERKEVKEPKPKLFAISAVAPSSEEVVSAVLQDLIIKIEKDQKRIKHEASLRLQTAAEEAKKVAAAEAKRLADEKLKIQKAEKLEQKAESVKAKHRKAALRKKAKKAEIRQSAKLARIEFEKRQIEKQEKEHKSALEKKAELARKEEGRNENIRKSEREIREVEAKLDLRHREIPLNDAANYLTLAQIPMRDFEANILRLLEKSGPDNKAFMTGSSVRDRLLQTLRFPDRLPCFDPKKDVDIVTSATEEQILTALKGMGVKASKLKGLFRLTHLDSFGNVIHIDIWQSKYKTLLADSNNRDLTINTFYANKYGLTFTPQSTGEQDLLNNRLKTPQAADESFGVDPSRILRIGHYAYKKKISIDPTLRSSMDKYLHLAPQMQEIFRIHSWMMKSFSSLYVSSDEAFDNLKFLINECFLSKLFDADDAKKIIDDLPWFEAEFKRKPVTRKEIYMLFYTSISCQTFVLDPEIVKRDIFSKNNLLKDELKDFSNFKVSSEVVSKRRMKFYKNLESTPWQFFTTPVSEPLTSEAPTARRLLREVS